MTDSPIKIYTDGSCSPNPGPGGWAAVLLFDGEKRVVDLSGSEKMTTNNRMELLAALKGLNSLETSSAVEVYTDSKYLQQGIEIWLPKWQEKGWRTLDGSEVKNRDLWELLEQQLQQHQVKWFWVKGHAGEKWNCRADELAVSARKSLPGMSVKKPANIGVNFYLGVTYSNKSRGGFWVVILHYQHHLKILSGHEVETTANRLYLFAVIQGLGALKREIPVNIHTRSGYLRDGLSRWVDGWKKRGWYTREGGRVSNMELWQELLTFKEKMNLNIIVPPDDEPPCHLQEAKEIARELQSLQSAG